MYAIIHSEHFKEPRMPVSHVAEYFVAILLLVTGLSHILCPRLWAQFFQDAFQKPYAGLWVGMLTLLCGLPVAIAHNYWAWDPRVIATVVGWGWSLKGTLYLLAPGLPKKVAAPHIQRPARFAYAGGFLMLLGLALLAGIARAQAHI
jgi:uncharacterized protein YjeT (DUF2065 family)